MAAKKVAKKRSGTKSPEKKAEQGAGAGTRAVAKAEAGMTPDQVQLAKLEQFITQLLSFERQSECNAVKAAVWIGEALNSAKPLLRGGFTEWARDRFPSISQTRQHYYRKISADFREQYADQLKLPDSRDRASCQELVRIGMSRTADKLVDEYVGERSLTEILYTIGARVKPAGGGFRPDVSEAAAFISGKRPDLQGVRTEEWDAPTIKEFCEYTKAQAMPADEARLKYEAAKASFDHALAKLADLINGSTPKYQRLSPAECAEVAKQLRAFADIVSRAGKSAGRSKGPKI